MNNEGLKLLDGFCFEQPRLHNSDLCDIINGTAHRAVFEFLTLFGA